MEKKNRTGTFGKWENVEGLGLHLVAVFGGIESKIRLGKGAHRPGLRKGAAIECRIELRDGAELVTDIKRPEPVR